MRYLIGSGYYAKPGDGRAAFASTWWSNTIRYTTIPELSSIVIVSAGHDTFIPFKCNVVELHGNLGNHLDLLEGRKPHKFSGWSGTVLSLAMLAYCDEADFVFKEQDCLWFGDCIGEMYRQIGDAGVIFGNYSKMPAAQSLFLVKHDYIPEFVRIFLGSPAQSDPEQLGEHKFASFEKDNPDKWKRFNFGYDRDRPFNIKDPFFYIQQVTPEDLQLLREGGLL